MPNILDPKFKYVPAEQTDIRRTFARVRREQKEREAAETITRESVAQFTPRRRQA